MRAVRWLVTVPLAAIGWLAAVLLAAASDALLERLCPAELLLSGLCTAIWFSAAEATAFAVSASVGAALFVGLPALVAPGHHRRVAFVAFAIGAAYAAWLLLGVGSSVAIPVAAAMASGLLTALWFPRTSGHAA